ALASSPRRRPSPRGRSIFHFVHHGGMDMQAHPATSPSVPVPPRRPAATYTLDSLAEMDSASLGHVYAEGMAPGTLAVLDGHPRGRMLAVRRLDAGPVARALRAFSGAKGFPWGGKSFSAKGAAAGVGINRVHLSGRHQLFPFETRIGPSVVDGRSAVV